MKKIRQLIGLFAALCLLLLLSPCSLAEEPAPAGDERFEGKTWEQVTEAFIEEHHADIGTVTIGYCNTVTGEEQYYKPDEYMISGSLFKVPLNMVFCEKVANGEIDWDTNIRGYSYEYLLRGTIIDSNNELAEQLWREIGKGAVRPYRVYREVIAPIMGEDPETADDMYYKNNYFTARQMIHCLKELYDHQEKYPRLIDTMKEAEPHKYFLQNPQKVEVAHKYGYFAEGSVLYLNDCGFCFTEDPFALVVFTAGIMHPYEFLTEYCALMIDYTEYQTALRHEEELRQSREAAMQALNPTQEAPEQGGNAAKADISAVTEPASDDSVNLVTPLLAVAVFGLTAGALAALLMLRRKKQLKLRWAIPALLFAAAALLLCVYAPGMKTAVSAGEQKKADPQESVSRFFDALIAKNYPMAYDCLYDYASLGLEEKPQNEAAQRMADALLDSYSYTLYGDCAVDGLHARQQVLFEMLDLDAMQADLKAGTEEAVRRLSEELPRSEVVDEQGNYLPALTERAYLEALQELLEHPDRYRTSVGLDLQLNYTTDGWRILTDSRLIQALSGHAPATKGGDGA